MKLNLDRKAAIHIAARTWQLKARLFRQSYIAVVDVGIEINQALNGVVGSSITLLEQRTEYMKPRVERFDRLLTAMEERLDQDEHPTAYQAGFAAGLLVGLFAHLQEVLFVAFDMKLVRLIHNFTGKLSRFTGLVLSASYKEVDRLENRTEALRELLEDEGTSNLASIALWAIGDSDQIRDILGDIREKHSSILLKRGKAAADLWKRKQIRREVRARVWGMVALITGSYRLAEWLRRHHG